VTGQRTGKRTAFLRAHLECKCIAKEHWKNGTDMRVHVELPVDPALALAKALAAYTLVQSAYRSAAWYA